MNACGLVVEYNPFHNGHKYHLDQSKKTSQADCMIAVMSGNFLQRGEPAIIDKYHRTKAAILQGVDLVVELPYAYAVQHSDIFAKGAVLTLGALGISSLCFGSEHGKIDAFIDAYHAFNKNKQSFKEEIKKHLDAGLSYPEASSLAYRKIGLTEGNVDLSKPNNILGFSYVKNIFESSHPIEPLTIQRTKSNYHDQEIDDTIASATSIRQQLINHQDFTIKVREAIPFQTQQQLRDYRIIAERWHDWEKYFSLLQYRILTMSLDELRTIHGVDEGIEYRLKSTIKDATSFQGWMQQLKTKRYTWTRLQRICTHILTNTKKQTVASVLENSRIPYIRVLGMNKTGQAYLNKVRKQLDVKVFTSIKKHNEPLLHLEEQASAAYYSIISAEKQIMLRKQKTSPPFRADSY